MTTSQAESLIDALNATFGHHKGYRASHAKGMRVCGRFLPALSGPGVMVPHLQAEHPVSARFSIGGGKPGISDKSLTVRGVGLRIGAGAGSWTLALISAPVFFANSAEQFRAFLEARRPDPALGGAKSRAGQGVQRSQSEYPASPTLSGHHAAMPVLHRRALSFRPLLRL